MWPRIVWKPKWALTFSEIKKKVCGSCSISQKSTLVINGRDIFVEDLSLDGTLLVDSTDEAEVTDRIHSTGASPFFLEILCFSSLSAYTRKYMKFI